MPIEAEEEEWATGHIALLGRDGESFLPNRGGGSMIGLVRQKGIRKLLPNQAEGGRA